jgi:hypothetical protein
MHIRRLVLDLMPLALFVASAGDASGFYNPGMGRWSSKDPSQEPGGKNLYVYVSNCPVAKFDPLGLCAFISVSASQVFGPTNHATLSYFTGNASPTLNKRYSVADLISQGARIEASLELERSPRYADRATQDWKVWAYAQGGLQTSSWVVSRVGISYILYGKSYGAGNIAAVFVGGETGKVKQKWDSMTSQAKSYRWASQDINKPSNFPNSLYGDPTIFGVPGNNSNTFARYILDQAGLKSDLYSLLGGLFPGNNMPADVPNVWSGTPVQWNAPMPPHP